MLSLEDILGRLERVKRCGSGYMALCPCHGERTASLSVRETEKGISLKCFGCGADRDKVLASLGWSWKDLASDDWRGGKGERTTPKGAPVIIATDWTRCLKGSVPLAGTPGKAYLASRGIPSVEFVSYHPAWEHWEKTGANEWNLLGYSRRVIFFVRDPEGKKVACQARSISDSEYGQKVVTRGTLSSGMFATPGAWTANPIIICEAPIDAISLHVAGFPALATCGVSMPPWFLIFAKSRRVFAATDADTAGKNAAREWLQMFRKAGIYGNRLWPTVGKDWNDMWNAEPERMKSEVAAFIATNGGSKYEG